MNAPSMPECFATLGALAAATRNIGLGSLVVNAGLRDPAIVANAAATVQEISGGRFILGLGAGASPSSTRLNLLDTCRNALSFRRGDSKYFLTINKFEPTRFDIINSPCDLQSFGQNLIATNTRDISCKCRSLICHHFELNSSSVNTVLSFNAAMN